MIPQYVGWRGAVVVLSVTLLMQSNNQAVAEFIPSGNPRLKELANNILEPKPLASEGILADIVLGPEAPHLRETLNLSSSSVVRSCQTPSGVKAFVYFEATVIPDHPALGGTTIRIAGFADVKASQTLHAPVVKVIQKRTQLQKPAQMLVPEHFDVPRTAQTKRFRFQPLAASDVIPDYDAVMTSRQRIQYCFGPNVSWPQEDLSLEQDLKDLCWHEEEWERRSSFSYAVYSPDKSRELACVYIYPSRKQGYDAKIIIWIRESEVTGGLDHELCEFTKSWLKEKWPFQKVAFPGRDISWEAWASVP